MESVVRLAIVLGGSALLALAAGRAADLFARYADARRPDTPLWGLLRRCRTPLHLVLLTAVFRWSYRATEWRPLLEHTAAVDQILLLCLIGGGAWLTVRFASAVVESSYARYATRARDAARLRRVRTQVTLITRVVSVAIGVVAAAFALVTFPTFRGLGTSLLASAGIIGIVAGVAAQSTLGNLFAGFQIAFGDMVRIGDTVVVDGEWGTVEEVTLTFLTVRTWDERRVTLPVSYFTSRPFENWTRGGNELTGSVFVHCDHSAPVGLMRAHLKDFLDTCPTWDGRAWDLAVTDTSPTAITVRAIVTAKDADDLWTTRCAVREDLVDWLTREHPGALPRIITAPAADAPGH
ncbi:MULTISPECIES: mechanosensitive ion channel family protein [Streptomyces]|uniref:mechanosensitive ion channel family protein n=1 Tax=Streptomyces TaxID=1883 RepID=UPI00093A61BC|nr:MULTISPECIES: mechanosensitive ion channel domain-containing protein [Streptomyces]MBX9421073.1 mechanosensitive ion channel family protein [Streptomyces lateritius]OKJ64083.1 mechanosensitive ion channel protein [Streptomyces sp. CB02261]